MLKDRSFQLDPLSVGGFVSSIIHPRAQRWTRHIL